MKEKPKQDSLNAKEKKLKKDAPNINIGILNRKNHMWTARFHCQVLVVTKITTFIRVQHENLQKEINFDLS